jgi:cytochrome b involved in lipid metabolism
MCHQPLEANATIAKKELVSPLHRYEEKENRNCWSNKNTKNCACYTMFEVSLHDNADSAWLVAGRNVYDVTSYISSHPGGRDCILKYAGGKKDVTEDLQFHSPRGKKIWEKYKIGTLDTSDNSFSFSWPERIRSLLSSILN